MRPAVSDRFSLVLPALGLGVLAFGALAVAMGRLGVAPRRPAVLERAGPEVSGAPWARDLGHAEAAIRDAAAGWSEPEPEPDRRSGADLPGDRRRAGSRAPRLSPRRQRSKPRRARSRGTRRSRGKAA